MTDAATRRDPYLRAQLTHPVLTPAEERALVEAAAAGSEAARAELVAHNLRLVANLVARRRPGGVPFMDLYQEGVIALIDAARNFKPAKGVRFSTYAGRCVRCVLIRASAGGASLIRTPEGVRQMLRRYDRAAAARPGADFATVAAAAGLPPSALPFVEAALKARTVVARGAPEPGERADALEVAAPEARDPGPDAGPCRAVSRILSPLPERDAALVRLVAVEGLTAREAGAQVGVSGLRAASIVRYALARLRAVRPADVTRGGGGGPCDAPGCSSRVVPGRKGLSLARFDMPGFGCHACFGRLTYRAKVGLDLTAPARRRKAAV